MKWWTPRPVSSPKIQGGASFSFHGLHPAFSLEDRKWGRLLFLRPGTTEEYLCRMFKRPFSKASVICHFIRVGGMISTVRVFPIHHFFFKGNLVDPRMRASNEVNAPSKLARYLLGMGAD